MPRKRRPSSFAFRFARYMDTAEAITSGNPRRIARRAKNIAVGRTAAKLGLFHALFGGRR
jgi:hypothetical protein